MNWEKTVDDYSEKIEKRLKNFLKNEVEEAKSYHQFIGNIYSDIQEFLSRRGKRIASCSTLLIYKGYKGKIDKKILKVCVGIELYRHAILIHDDLVDMDEKRRGGPTLHRKFINCYSPYDNRFGEATAIFTSNILYSLALKAIIDSGFPKNRINQIVNLTSNGYQEVNESQILDVLFEKKDVTVDEWTIMASKRAASLFKVTLLTGAILANAPENDFSLLTAIGENIGFSFDIQDDIIDSFASKEEYGRSTCLDISKNKKPLHIIHALKADTKKSEALKCLLGKQFLSFGEKDLARKLIRETKGLEKAKKTSKKYAKKAKEIIEETTLDDDIKEFFKNFIGYIEQSLDWYK